MRLIGCPTERRRRDWASLPGPIQVVFKSTERVSDPEDTT